MGLPDHARANLRRVGAHQVHSAVVVEDAGEHAIPLLDDPAFGVGRIVGQASDAQGHAVGRRPMAPNVHHEDRVIPGKRVQVFLGGYRLIGQDEIVAHQPLASRLAAQGIRQGTL